MKKRNIFIVMLVFLVLLLSAIGFYCYVGHTNVEIKYQNKSKDNTNILNVRCLYELTEEIDISTGEFATSENEFGIYKTKHSSKKYGLYTYSFDVEVNGNIISPQILIVKTDWKANYDVEIEFVVDSTATTSTLSVSVNGVKRTETFEDIQNTDITLQVGP
ncbi:MAG: hypothetical protein MJZ11_12935 [Lachnospiraceae bacterium]|nr:hypothetical protein [Lachnospiraceae bacterium]MCQ2082553.1 hypothetical protein [Lachnospiraceae bacterium]